MVQNQCLFWFLPEVPRAIRLRALVWSRQGPSAPGSLGRTRHRGDTSWGGRGHPSTRKEGLASGHSQGCRDPRGTRSPDVYPGSTWSQVNAGPGPQGTQLHTARPPPRPLPHGPVTGWWWVLFFTPVLLNWTNIIGQLFQCYWRTSCSFPGSNLGLIISPFKELCPRFTVFG